MLYVPRFLREYASHIKKNIHFSTLPDEEKTALIEAVERQENMVAAGTVTVPSAMEELVRIQKKVRT